MNEELKTGKEEPQSSNEELSTIHEQVLHRIAERSQINIDFLSLLNSTDIPLLVVGNDLTIRLYTSSACAKMNLLPADIGRPIADIHHSVTVRNIEDLIRRVIETGQPLNEELRDRDNRWHMLRISPYRTAGNTEGAVIVLVDIDDVKRAQELLIEQTAMLKLADRRKNEFLAMLGHELRNPLGPMSNVLHILRMPGVHQQDHNDALSVFERQLAQLTRIVEDLLDATRISHGKIELRREHLELNTILRAAVETSRPMLEAHGHALETHFCSEHLCVHVDPLRLTQVLVNLLNNAAKFTPKKGHIRLSCRPSAHDRNRAEISVRDDGIGIKPELLPHVFELFTQGETYENKRHGGLGIGLTLARTLVEMHEGTIAVSSKGDGHGTEFIVCLPLATPPADTVLSTHAKADVTPRSGRILVIEDNADQAHTLATLLSMWGYEVKTAHEGGEGIKVAETFMPDVVLVDLGLPGISGYEVARRLRLHPKLQSACIVAQTGWGDTADRRRTTQAGFDHHMLKPLDLQELREVIDRARR